MVVMNEADLHSQQGMERAFGDYFQRASREQDGTLNAMLDAKFLSCDYGARRLRLRFDIKPWMSNPGGMAHGGIMASIMDLTMGIVSRYFSGGGMTPTVSMEISYLRAVPVGSAVTAEAVCTMSGRSLCAVSSSAWVGEEPEELSVTATAVYHVHRKGELVK